MMRRDETNRFRPRLEALEARDMPSLAGFILFGLTNNLNQTDMKVRTDNMTLTNDVNTLKTLSVGNNVLTKTPGIVNTAQNAAATTVNNDRAALQTDFTALQNQHTNFRNTAFFFLFSGAFDSSDLFFLLGAGQASMNATNDVNSIPGTVMTQGTQTTNLLNMLGGTTQTVNQVLNFFSFPNLTIM
jgi:hypothetical protein